MKRPGRRAGGIGRAVDGVAAGVAARVADMGGCPRGCLCFVLIARQGRNQEQNTRCGCGWLGRVWLRSRLQALQLGMDFVQAPHRLLVLLDFPSGRLGHGRCQGSRMINRRWTQMDANGTRTAGTLPQCGRCLGFGSARPSLLRTECLIFVPRCGAQSTQCLSSGWLGCVSMRSARLDLGRGDHSRSV
jgi:hypothetical protein